MGHEFASANPPVATRRWAMAYSSVERADVLWREGNKEEAYRLIHFAYKLYDEAFLKTDEPAA